MQEYKCFSTPLMRFLTLKGFMYSEIKQHRSGSYYFTYYITPELSAALTEFSELKKQFKANQN